MSIGLERFVHGIPFDASMFAPPQPAPAEPPDSPAAASCSSSIGRNSDCSAGGVDDDADGEVQSSYKGPLDTMDALEDSLPIKRGVSKFYCGKSKSFTSLEDVVFSCSSVKDLAKPEDPYTRKRKNLIAFSPTWDRTRPRDGSQGTEGGISKRLANSSRNNLCRTVSTSSSGSNDHSSEEDHEAQRHLPPLHPRSKPPDAAVTLGFASHEKKSFPMRSFSMTDLQGVARLNDRSAGGGSAD